MHLREGPGDRVRISFRENTVAEVENMTQSITGGDGPIGLTTDAADLVSDHVRSGQEDGRIQISLDRTDTPLSRDSGVTGLVGGGQG